MDTNILLEYAVAASQQPRELGSSARSSQGSMQSSIMQIFITSSSWPKLGRVSYQNDRFDKIPMGWN
ncbi:hypothetical protein FRX31_033330 [Thalictrum thalictroides]|uniref:Uncharacterized protein n=1 Tax=Thalictrum thalictroides TaxID=46969 RepID=A0A7J6UWT9_THATH|nr:hypothetical protein FRX31_033330 [Thalictrum thalictroides]